MIQISRRPRTRGLVIRAVSALIVAGSALMLSAPSASAWSLPQVCSGAAEANVCLEGYTNDPYVQVHVGIDVWMSAQEAQAIIAQPGNAFSATLLGDDGASKQYLQTLPLSWEGAGASNISAEFDMAVQRSRLNEDGDGWWGCDRDEVFARVSLYDARDRSTRTFDSPHWSVCF
jgi:hypothetical protein